MSLEIITNKLEIPQVHPNQFPDLVEFMKLPHNDLPVSLYEEYYQLATELGYPALKNYFNIQTLDKNGRLDDETGRTMSRSMLRNQWNYMLVEMGAVNGVLGDASFGSGYLSWKGVTGAIATSFGTTAQAYANGGTLESGQGGGLLCSAGYSNYGLVVGITNTAVTFNDYVLAAKCTEGSGANQLNYQAVAAPVKSWSAGNMEFTAQFIRYANNNSANPIDLVESGVIQLSYYGYYSNYYCLMIRDVFATKTVNAGGQVKMVYDFVSNTFPE
jgi:hypothetical protein